MPLSLRLERGLRGAHFTCSSSLRRSGLAQLVHNPCRACLTTTAVREGAHAAPEAGCSARAHEQHASRAGLSHGADLGWRTDFADAYTLVSVVGQGNFGTVWLASAKHDPSYQVAVKVVPKHRPGVDKQEVLASIRREVAVWRTVSSDSPFVAELLGLYEDEGSVYLVQQLCRGGDLAGLLKDGPLPEASCCAVAWCVLSAIRDCHEHHLAMVDVKPQNFLLVSEADVRMTRPGGQPGPCVVACDFGCAMPLSQLSHGGAKRAGSPVFFAPEQFTSTYGLEVDLWAAGVTLYLLLTGRYPFWDGKREENHKLPAYQVMLAVCSAPIDMVCLQRHGVSKEAQNLLAQLLDRNPATRVTAAQALRHPWFSRWLPVHEGSPHHGAHSAHSGGEGEAQQRARRAAVEHAPHMKPHRPPAQCGNGDTFPAPRSARSSSAGSIDLVGRSTAGGAGGAANNIVTLPGVGGVSGEDYHHAASEVVGPQRAGQDAMLSIEPCISASSEDEAAALTQGAGAG